MFIQTESTPNPATLKFLPGREVMGEGGVADFPDASSSGRSPLAKALFSIPEVSRVFFGADFISVTKRDGDWKHLKPAILGAVMELTLKLRGGRTGAACSRLRLCAMTPQVREVFGVMRLDDAVEIYPDLARALASFGDGPDAKASKGI